MASISEFGIPGVGTGIIRPKLLHQFRVVFYKPSTDFTEVDEALMLLAEQIVKADCRQPIEFQSNPFGLIMANKPLKLTFNDDIVNNAVNAILEAVNNDKRFDVAVEQLDGDVTVVSRTCYHDAYFVSLKEDSAYDYNYTTNKSSLQLNIDVLDPLLCSHPELLKMVQAFTKSLNITVSKDDQRTVCVNKTVSIQYSKMELRT